MTKGPRKSIIASFASFGTEPSGGEADKPTAPASATPPRVGASVIGATQRSLVELREERDRLQAMVDAGGTRPIDPALVDPSPFRDRMPDDDEASFETFRRLFAAEGQKIPVEVRPHPEASERFQLVFGHRRWRAASELGVPLRAIVVEKSDAEVAVSQGIENTARQDLSWIERAAFAATMEAAGIKARDIRAALGIDDSELTRFRTVLRSIPPELVAAIGRAPKAGRPRWLELARLAGEFPNRLMVLVETLAGAKVSSSDERLAKALVFMQGQSSVSTAFTLDLCGRDDLLLAKAVLAKGTLRLTPEKALAGEWDAFIREELPELGRRFSDWQAYRKKK